MTCPMIAWVTLVLAAPGPKDPAPATPSGPALVGQWACVTVTLGGKTTPGTGVTWEFDKDGWLQTRLDRHEVAFRYEASPSKDPAEVGWGGGFTLVGIYNVDGDKLTLCYTDAWDAARPAKFESPDGSKTVLMTFKRIGKAQK